MPEKFFAGPVVAVLAAARWRAQTQAKHDFVVRSSVKRAEQFKEADDRGEYGIALNPVYLGISAKVDEQGRIVVGLVSHDGTYSIDFAVHVLGQCTRTNQEGKAADDDLSDLEGGQSKPASELSAGQRSRALTDFLLYKISKYQWDHQYQFVGTGISRVLFEMAPRLPARLWAELDIVPMIFEKGFHNAEGDPASITIDEEADSMARKCLMFFNPSLQPRIEIGYRNKVEVDCRSSIQITHLDQYRETVGKRTWDATMHFANSMKKRGTSIAFFNSTPQGGGVALMRHALIRFFRHLGIDARWYVPFPKPEVFRITKTNHNLLQCVADPDDRLTDDMKKKLDEWCRGNAERFWLKQGAPLAARSDGGADVIVVDDPQMPALVNIAKTVDPGRPVIFRSHIQIRSDVADQKGTPTAEVWDWVWNHVQNADLFVSHPVRGFVPKSVDVNKVGYLPATTDWLDGLNKQMSEFTTRHYFHQLQAESFKYKMHNWLDFPKRQYIVQIARFDPSKGIPDVLASYAELRHNQLADWPREKTPQLVIAGHGALDDPDGSRILDETLSALEEKYTDIADDVVVMRLGPCDQYLNALMSNAKVALQLSTREGFEVKVSEALHKGIPIIATKAGGIPLQVQDKKAGFLVQPSDYKAVAQHLYELFSDKELYEKMSKFAAGHVSDEVGTVGNALSWLYMADTLAQGKELLPDCRWINDMARMEAGLPYVDGETRLPRIADLDLN